MNNPSNTPSGFCQCGCGQRTNIVKQDDPKRGYKKGDYRRFVNYHCSNKNHLVSKTCVVCGDTFLPQKRNRQETQKTCSADCRNAHNARISIKERADVLRGRGKGKAYPKRDGRHEHRVVMEKLLGRPLTSDEIVHHKDGNIFNNSPDNLELMTRAGHAILHLHGYVRSESNDELLRESAASY